MWKRPTAVSKLGITLTPLSSCGTRIFRPAGSMDFRLGARRFCCPALPTIFCKSLLASDLSDFVHTTLCFGMFLQEHFPTLQAAPQGYQANHPCTNIDAMLIAL